MATTALIAILSAGSVANAAPSDAPMVRSESTAQTAAASVTRLAGADRYETSVAVSQRYGPGVTAAFVATGADYPDALTGAAAAAKLGAPLLLTRPSALPAIVRDELLRLNPAKIFVLGGPSVVSASVFSELSTIAPVERISGADRYSTSEKVVDKVYGKTTKIFLATGRGFADALAAGSAAGSLGAPLLLVSGATTVLPTATMNALVRWGVTDIAIAGGHSAIDIRIEQQLRTVGYNVSRQSGASRYETAAAIRDEFFADATPQAVFVATGADFPDALSGAALAGRMHAPLLLTRPECVPWAPRAILSSTTAPERIVIGSEAVVSAAAAANTPCADAAPFIPSFPTTGWRFDPAVSPPYYDIPAMRVDDPTVQLDSTGLRIYLRRDNGQRADHPVAYAQYGLAALAEYQKTGEQIWLQRALRQADRLEEMHTDRNGAWWFPYMFPWTYYQRTLTIPWWSGMAQGQVLSLFVRLHEETGDARWRTAADHTWASFVQPRSGVEPWSTIVDGNRLFFEEYAGNQPPLLVLNGQVFAIFGVWDYWALTGNPQALTYLDGASTTVLKIMPLVREPGEISYYCVQQPYCHSELWQNKAYHGTHSWQLFTLARLTGDPKFAEWGQLLRDDYPPKTLRSTPLDDVPPLGWEGGPPQ